jgi:hypothetical protein
MVLTSTLSCGVRCCACIETKKKKLKMQIKVLTVRVLYIRTTRRQYVDTDVNRSKTLLNR